MSKNKKQIRNLFKTACFTRDKYRCVMCGKKSTPEKIDQEMDCHHIVDRNELPGGGYVLENGITLCKDDCHLKAEEYHSTGTAAPGFSIDDLYAAIKSSHTRAIAASEKL